jgi:hypothetical protein
MSLMGPASLEFRLPSATPTDGLIVARPIDTAPANLLALSLSAFGLQFRVSSLDDAMHDATATKLVIGFATSIDTDHLKRLDHWCATSGIQWLRCVIAPADGFADAGPSLRPGGGRLADFDRAYGQPRGTLPERRNSIFELQFWTRLMAQPLGELCLSARTAYPSDKFVRIRMDEFHSETMRAILLNEAEESSAAAPFLLFEASVAYTAPTPNPAALMTRNRSFVAASLRPNEYPNSPTRACSMPAPLGSLSVSDLLAQVNEPEASLCPEHMAALLLYGAGHRSCDLSRSAVTRFAANAGNMGSCTVSYLMLGSDIADASLFIYQAESHTEAQFEPYGLSRRASRLLSSVDALETVEALFFFSGNVERMQAKYGGFGYRLALMDAGVALSQMSLVARAFGFHLQPAHQLSRLKASQLLNVREDKTHVTLTAALRREACASIARAGQQRSEEMDCRPLRFIRPEMQAATLRHMALRSSSRCGQSGAANVSVSRANASSERRPSLTDVLLSRRSVRKFSTSPVTAEILQPLVAAAFREDRKEWACRPELELSFHVLLKEGPHSAGSIFRYCQQTEDLQMVAQLATDCQFPSLYVDARFQHAPVAIWIAGNLGEVEDSREYEELLIRAGASANRIWLLALEHGLCGTIAAGILPQPASKALALDGWREHPLCAILLGFSMNRISRPSPSSGGGNVRL